MHVTTPPEWQHLAIYAVGAAVLITLLLRLPYVGRVIRLLFSIALLAFFIFIVMQQAPYQPGLERLSQQLGLDNQQVVGSELRVRMAPDGHFWVDASINGVKQRMLIDSGATVTAISEETARAAGVGAGAGVTPVVLRTANGIAEARTGRVKQIRVGNIIARNLRIVTSPGMGNLNVIGMNFLSLLESWQVEGRTLILVPHHPQARAP